jgi:RNA polymerase sigma factor (sigma-70 family)
MPFDAPHAISARQTLAAMQVSDWQLAKLKRADSAMQAEVFRLFEKPLYTFCMRMLAHRADALDAMQESFVQSFTQVSQFRGSSPFGAWMRAIALRLCLKRWQARQQWASNTATLDDGDDAAPSASHLMVGHADAQIDLESALYQLTDQARAVVWLYCVEGYSHQEIADSFGLSVSFSKSTLARALKNLRTQLSPSENCHASID